MLAGGASLRWLVCIFLMSRLFMATLPGKYMTVCVLLMDSVRRGVRNLADPIGFDSANPEDRMSQLAVIMLALTKRNELMQSVERPLPLPMPMPLPVPLPPAKAEKSAGRAWSIRRNLPTPHSCVTRGLDLGDRAGTWHHPVQPSRPPADPATRDADRREPAELLRARPLHGLVVRPAFQAL